MAETDKLGVATKPLNVDKFSNWLNEHRDKPVLRMATKLAERITSPNVLGFVEYYLSADKMQSQSEWLAGEIYWLYFKAPEETQRKFIEAMCETKGVELPDLKRTPRQRLVTALYGDDPILIEDGDGKYDSKGGKRITAAIRTFEEHMGIYQQDRKTRKKEHIPRKTKDFLFKVYEVGKPNEIRILQVLMQRAFGKKAAETIEIPAMAVSA